MEGRRIAQHIVEISNVHCSPERVWDRMLMQSIRKQSRSE